MSDFKIAFNHTLKFEGEYSDNVSDRGGKTKYGITEKVARDYGYFGRMVDLHLVVAMKIYKKNYWKSLKLGSIHSQKIANELFDTGVNMGIKTSAKFLQKACNLLTNNKLKVDGVIGSQTLSVANGINEQILLKVLNGLQFEKYRRIVLIRPSQKIFFKGWMKRIS